MKILILILICGAGLVLFVALIRHILLRIVADCIKELEEEKAWRERGKKVEPEKLMPGIGDPD